MGAQISAPQWIDSVTPVREAILDKAKRYGTPDLPFVVAINALSEFLDDDQIIEALFGSEAWVFSPGDDDLRFQRQLNGVWTSPSGQYGRLSAVLMFRQLYPQNFPRAFVRLYHHYAPTMPLTGPLTRLPQAVAREQIEYLEGDSLAQIFGVPPDWLAECRASPSAG